MVPKRFRCTEGNEEETRQKRENFSDFSIELKSGSTGKKMEALDRPVFAKVVELLFSPGLVLFGERVECKQNAGEVRGTAGEKEGNREAARDVGSTLIMNPAMHRRS